MIKLIVGLGNPGSEYTKTRHNAGFWFVDALAAKFGCTFSGESRFHGEAARINSTTVDCRLLKPLTYMNDSGRAVQAMIDYFKISDDEILVAHDELDLEPGSVRLKRGGGHGGHNGLRDIIAMTGNKNFLRLRIGIGHPGHKDAVTPYVLGRASAEQQDDIDRALDKAIDAMSLVFGDDIQQAMNMLHTKNS